jgi:hypothetical protein
MARSSRPRNDPPASAPAAKPAASGATHAPLIRQAWIFLALWIAFGILLEGLNAFRSPAYMDAQVRRDMFRLAHSHGTLMNLVLLAAALCARLDLITLGRWAAAGLRLSVLLLPFGFFFGGVWPFEEEPGPAILLVPVGAVLLLAASVYICLTLPKR